MYQTTMDRNRRERPSDTSSREYRGYTLVYMPNGHVLVHAGTGSVPPSGKLIQVTNSEDDAVKLVDALQA